MPRRLVVALLGLALTCSLSGGAGTASAVRVVQPYDFDGDGRPELVVGAAGLQVGTHGAVGGVVVLPASTAGLSLEARVITADSPGVVGEVESDEHFGASLASGDFDADGYADLAVGRPVAHLGTGGVTVLFGSRTGLSGGRSVQLSAPGGREDDVFGSALAAGDFDGDGRTDLAVGAPRAGATAGLRGEGTVSVFAGARDGIAASPSVVLGGQTARPGPDAVFDEGFGSTMAVGDLDQDGSEDLVVGSSGSGYTDGPGEPGALSACPGSAGGLTACSRLDRQPAYAMATALEVGDVSGSARPEIVLGVPRADPERSPAGTVQILSLSGPRTSTTVTRFELTQGSRGVRGSNHEGDDFGTSVALGDLDHDGFDDLVIGASGEKVRGKRGAGRVTVVYGGSSGYRRSGTLVYDQATKGVPGKPEKWDDFGTSVALVDHDGDGHLDLAVGAAGEDDGNGAVTTLRGAGRSFTTTRSRTFTVGDLGYPAPRFAGLGSPVR